MKRKLTVILCASALTALLLSGCGTKKNETTAAAETTVAAETTIEETETATEETATEAATEASKTAALEDGTYEAEFNTDSSMFHANEACDGKGTLTVENGVMTLHVSLVSKSIVNLFPGTAADAQKEGADCCSRPPIQ